MQRFCTLSAGGEAEIDSFKFSKMLKDTEYVYRPCLIQAYKGLASQAHQSLSSQALVSVSGHEHT
jgi:hypothetical protein